MTREDWRRSWKPWLRGTAIGFPLGVLPCGGAEIPTFLSYMVEKRLSPRPEEFGRGAIEGVAGPEAANNAAAAGVLVPLLTLGLPSSATAAVLLSAFQQYGLQPGPLLFTARPDLVWTLIASLYIGNVMLLVLNLPLARVWARIMLVPRSLLFAGILRAGVARRLQPQSLDARPRAALCRRRRWLHDAHSRHSAGAGGARPHSRSDGGAAFPPRRRDRRRRLLGVPTRPLSASLLLASLLVLLAPLWSRRVSKHKHGVDDNANTIHRLVMFLDERNLSPVERILFHFIIRAFVQDWFRLKTFKRWCSRKACWSWLNSPTFTACSMAHFSRSSHADFGNYEEPSINGEADIALVEKMVDMG